MIWFKLALREERVLISCNRMWLATNENLAQWGSERPLNWLCIWTIHDRKARICLSPSICLLKKNGKKIMKNPKSYVLTREKIECRHSQFARPFTFKVLGSLLPGKSSMHPLQVHKSNTLCKTYVPTYPTDTAPWKFNLCTHGSRSIHQISYHHVFLKMWMVWLKRAAIVSAYRKSVRV